MTQQNCGLDEGLQGVTSRKARVEQIWSAFPQIADIDCARGHFADGPFAEIRDMTRSPHRQELQVWEGGTKRSQSSEGLRPRVSKMHGTRGSGKPCSLGVMRTAAARGLTIRWPARSRLLRDEVQKI